MKLATHAPTPADILTRGLPPGWELWEYPGRLQPWTVWHDKRNDPQWSEPWGFSDYHAKTARSIFGFFRWGLEAEEYIRGLAAKVRPGPAVSRPKLGRAKEGA